MPIKLLLVISILTLISSCQNNKHSSDLTPIASDTLTIDSIGPDYIDAFRPHVLTNYSGEDIYRMVEQKPFAFHKYDVMFKMDIDTIIAYEDSLFAVRFHGALDRRISFDCHNCSAPQALAVFVQRGDQYIPLKVVDVSDAFVSAWGGVSPLELRFENTITPGPMLFSTNTDGAQGNYDQYVHAIDLSLATLGFERFRFSNPTRREQIFFPDSDKLESWGFPKEKVTQSWKEAYYVTDTDLMYIFNKENSSVDVIRHHRAYWNVWYGPSGIVEVEKIMDSEYRDTLSYSVQGNINVAN